MSRAVASFGYIGLLPRFAGSLASAGAVLLGWLAHRAGGFPLYALATALVIGLGFWAVRAELRRAVPGRWRETVVDEAAGMLLTLAPLSAGLWLAGARPEAFPWPGWTLSFLLFRLLVAWQPWPVAVVARRGGAGGIMLDDLVAGALAALTVTLAAAIAHGGAA